jgi:hypothetical protein
MMIAEAQEISEGSPGITLAYDLVIISRLWLKEGVTQTEPEEMEVDFTE